MGKIALALPNCCIFIFSAQHQPTVTSNRSDSFSIYSNLHITETRVLVQFADGENSNITLDAPSGEWLIIYGTQDVIEMWKDQIDSSIKAIANLNVRNRLHKIAPTFLSLVSAS